MASVSVYIPTPMRRLTNGQAHVDVEVQPGRTSLAELVDLIEARHPGLKSEIWEGDDFKHYVNVYMNGEEVRALEGAATRLREGDQVAFVPMLAGGGPAERLTITRAQRDEMIAHARRDYPNECCGMVSGRGMVASQVYPLRNAAASPFLYEIHRDDLKKIIEIENDGEELVAIYHSHTHTEAFPSQTDVRLAYYPESAYVIVSLADQASPSVRAFRIVDGSVAEMEVEVR
jgi:proteasome lid subunit RPN8/RPN11/molybdopterin converting factor small subunit